LTHIRRALDGYQGRREPTGDAERAAVAMVLRRGVEAPGEPEVLLIERVRRPGDPWSGQMAFPGGRRELGDASLRATAERETSEEVGLDLGGAQSLARLDDVRGRPRRPRGIVVSAFVYHLASTLEVRPNREVEEALWVPLSHLLDPERRVDYRYPLAPEMVFPGVVVGDPERHVVWGLTFRFLEIFFTVLDVPFPPASSTETGR
jgi:8-oxo-dGTP pyrophosphatase MutT (NUDIX family)